MAYRKCPCGFYVSGPSAEEADVELRAHECIMTARSELAALKAENERLRAVLGRVLRWIDNSDSTYDLELFVRAALAPPEATEGEGNRE